MMNGRLDFRICPPNKCPILNTKLSGGQILKALLFRPIKKIVVFQVPCQKKTGSVGRLYFFFLFTFFFFG